MKIPAEARYTSDNGVHIEFRTAPWDCQQCPIATEKVERIQACYKKLRESNSWNPVEGDKDVFIPKSFLVDDDIAGTVQDYFVLADSIDSSSSVCFKKSEQIISDGNITGIYCPSNNQEYYYNTKEVK